MTRERREADRRLRRGPLVPPAPVAPLPAADEPGFRTALAQAVERARSDRRRLSLVIVELDAPDDRRLGEVLASVRRAIRASDGAWRTGPDRVAVLLSDAGGPGAEPAFARLAGAVAGSGGAARLGRAALGPGVGPDDLVMIADGDLRPLPAAR